MYSSLRPTIHRGRLRSLWNSGCRGIGMTLTSTLAVEEARRNLDIKFPDCLPRLESILSKVRVVSSVSGPTCPIDLPEKDRPIFLAAVKCRATHLLTGDVRHFGPFLNDPSKQQDFDHDGYGFSRKTGQR